MFFVSSPISFAQDYRYNGEIMGEVIGLDGMDYWQVNAQCISTYKWDVSGQECYLTDDYETAYIEGWGNNISNFGFHTPWGHEGGHYDIAFGEYEFTFNLAGSEDDTSFILDLRDADWTKNYGSPFDITIRWDIDNRELKYRIGGSGNTYYDLVDETIWDLLDEAPPNKEAFQPTKPLGFRCTNANQTGEHPHFVWDGTQWPNGIRGQRTITVYYIIFRNLRRVATDITNLEWTDNSVTIGQQGTSFNYFVRAKLSKSPESERSDIVYITGNLSKKQIPESMNSSEKDNCSEEFKLMNVVCHPNPVNPTTNIIYSLSKVGVVYLTIYNLMGQRIAELVNEKKFAGTYQVSFDGSSLAGGIYFVHLEFNNQHLIRKVLLIK